MIMNRTETTHTVNIMPLVSPGKKAVVSTMQMVSCVEYEANGISSVARTWRCELGSIWAVSTVGMP